MSVFLVFTAMTAKANSSFSITFTSTIPNNFSIEWSAVANGNYMYYVVDGVEYKYFQMNGDVAHYLPGAGTILGRGKYKYRQGMTSKTVTLSNSNIYSDSDIWIGFEITPDQLTPIDISMTFSDTGTKLFNNVILEIYEIEGGIIDDSFRDTVDNSLGYASYSSDGTVGSQSIVWNTTSHPLLSNLGTEARSVTFTTNNFSYTKIGATTITSIYLRIKSNVISAVSDLMGNLVISISGV